MRTIAFVFICTVFSLFSTQAYACTGFPGGVSTTELQVSINSIEAKLSDEAKLSSFEKVKFLWESTDASSGIEGDCDAVSVNAKVNATMRNDKNQFCFSSINVTYIKSTQGVFNMFKAKIDDVQCM